MRVVMWCDMEGVAGIIHWDQVNHTAAQYEEGRRLYTGEINAAVRGAKKAGAREIVVIDGHGAGGGYSFNSWIKDKLEPGAEYVTGYRWACYVEPLKSGFDAVLLPGAHAMAGTPDGVLCHTISSEAWFEATINNVPVGESGLVAAIAGSFDVPCVFVSGDEATCRECKSLIGESIATAPVKTGLDRYSARSLAHADACDLIERKVEDALKGRATWPKPYKVSAPVEFKVTLHTPDKVREYINRKGVEITGPRTLVSRGETFWEVWNQFWRHA